MSLVSEIERVLTFAKELKIPVVISEWQSPDLFPFCDRSPVMRACIDVPNRTIHMDRVELEGTNRKAARGLLHELAHVITEEPPEWANEIADGMLAWEWHHGKRLWLTGWRRWMEGFTLGVEDDHHDWYMVSRERRAEIMRASRKAAIERGLI